MKLSLTLNIPIFLRERFILVMLEVTTFRIERCGQDRSVTFPVQYSEQGLRDCVCLI
jgi:hypothetical protein